MQVGALQAYACMQPGRACCSWPRARHARRRPSGGGRPVAAVPLPGGRPAHLPLLIVLLEPTAARRALGHCAPAVRAAGQLEPTSPGRHCCNTQCAARMSSHAHRLWAHMSLGLNDSVRRAVAGRHGSDTSAGDRGEGSSRCARMRQPGRRRPWRSRCTVRWPIFPIYCRLPAGHSSRAAQRGHQGPAATARPEWPPLFRRQKAPQGP